MKISSTSNGVFQNNNMHYHVKKLRWKAKDSRIAKGILKKKKKVENRLPCDLDSGVRKISVSRNKNGPPLLLLLPGCPPPPATWIDIIALCICTKNYLPNSFYWLFSKILCFYIKQCWYLYQSSPQGLLALPGMGAALLSMLLELFSQGKDVPLP